MYGATPVSISGLRRPQMSMNPSQPLLPRKKDKSVALQKKKQPVYTVYPYLVPITPPATPPRRSSDPDLETGLAYQNHTPKPVHPHRADIVHGLPTPTEESADMMISYGTMRHAEVYIVKTAGGEQQSNANNVMADAAVLESVRQKAQRSRDYERATALGELIFRIVAVLLFSAYFLFLVWKFWERWEVEGWHHPHGSGVPPPCLGEGC